MTADFVLGASTMACLVIVLFFARFWRDSGDRFFALFALAFLIFGVNRFVLLFLDEDDESRRTIVYLMRLGAFGLIIAAIVDKNRSSEPAREPARVA